MFSKNEIVSDSFKNPKRILIVRFSTVGDVLHGVPLLIALRTRFPHTEIAWLSEEKTSILLRGHTALDRLILVKKNWFKSWTDIALLRRRLQLFAPDITIDLHGNLKSSFAAWLSGAKKRVGFGGPDSRRGSRWLNNCRIVPTEEHQIDRNLQLLEPFGIFGSSIDFDLPECEMDRRNARNLLNREGLYGNFAILDVGADWKSKRWREERHAELARYLLEQWNLPSLIVWSTPEEQNLAETVIDLAEGAAYLASSTTSGEFASLCRMATLFIGSDTDSLHIADAVGTRCVGLYGPVSAKQNGPYGPYNRSIQLRSLDGSNANIHRSSLKSNQNLLDVIDVPTVCSVCDEILAELQNPATIPMSTFQNDVAPKKAA